MSWGSCYSRFPNARRRGHPPGATYLSTGWSLPNAAYTRHHEHWAAERRATEKIVSYCWAKSCTKYAIESAFFSGAVTGLMTGNTSGGGESLATFALKANIRQLMGS